MLSAVLRLGVRCQSGEGWFETGQKGTLPTTEHLTQMFAITRCGCGCSTNELLRHVVADAK